MDRVDFERRLAGLVRSLPEGDRLKVLEFAESLAVGRPLFLAAGGDSAAIRLGSTAYSGMIVTKDGAEPFFFDALAGAVRLGEHVILQGRIKPEGYEKVLVRKLVGALSGLDALEVRIGEFHCHVCDGWADATRSDWSGSICMSCSLDRASDMADMHGDD